jgi:hypothetical protein
MRIGGFSCLTRRRPPVTHTDALFADQSQSILDNLVALLAKVQRGIARTQNAVICNTGVEPSRSTPMPLLIEIERIRVAGMTDLFPW